VPALTLTPPVKEFCEKPFNVSVPAPSLVSPAVLAPILRLEPLPMIADRPLLTVMLPVFGVLPSDGTLLAPVTVAAPHSKVRLLA